MAGRSDTRQLTITNEGGGVLEGRLTVSFPWRLALADYRVKAGATETIDVTFQPNEARNFVGQITLLGANGGQTSVLLEGTAASPIALAPAQLQIDVPQGENDPRTGSVALTNRTEHALRLKIETGSSVQAIEEVALAPKETKKILIKVLPDRAVPVHERFAIIGPGFSTRLQIDAEGLPPKRTVESRIAPVPTRPVMVSPAPVITRGHTASVPSAPTPTLTSQPRTELLVAVSAQRLDSSRWELRWPRPKSPVAKYRIDERVLLLDGSEELQTGWRQLAATEISTSGDALIALIKGLDPRQLHMLKVTALSANGATLWEALLVALSPPPGTSRSGRGWLLIFGLALIVFLVLRWRANRRL